MLVSNLQQFLRLLAPPLAAAGINLSSQKNITGSLDAVAAALEPFKEMNTEQLAELLRIAEEYRRTDKIPEWVVNNIMGPGKKKTPKSPKVPKITTADALARLKDVQQRCMSMEPSQIAQEVQGLSGMSINELKEVQRGFLGVTIGKKKDELLAALQKKIDDYRTSRDRVDGILAN